LPLQRRIKTLNNGRHKIRVVRRNVLGFVIDRPRLQRITESGRQREIDTIQKRRRDSREGGCGTKRWDRTVDAEETLRHRPRPGVSRPEYRFVFSKVRDRPTQSNSRLEAFVVVMIQLQAWVRRVWTHRLDARQRPCGGPWRPQRIVEGRAG